MLQLEEPIIGLSSCTLISQGAEARVFTANFLGRAVVLKQRFSKQYRHPALDSKLTHVRLKQEVRSILRARKMGVACPLVLWVEHEAATIYMERIQGRLVKQLLLDNTLSQEELMGMLQSVGQAVAMLHDGGLVHGDLTTSNMMLRDGDHALVLIDFGLSYNSTMSEDKGVDLYVLERAFSSAHSKHGDLFSTVLESYKKHSRQWSSTFNKFAEVRMRGRKRAMVG